MEGRKTNISITPSMMLEYLYCPRFIYFMKVLDIPQNEEMRFKIIKGREVHKYKTLTNKDYLRKKIGVREKIIDEELYSTRYRFHGKVDEILFLVNNTAAPLDYKYAEYKNKIYNTYKTQSLMYGILIKEQYNINVNYGFIVYTRSRNHIEKIDFAEKDYIKVFNDIEKIFYILENNYFPKSTSVKSRCNDCCYRNICCK